jgi:hypothetical protein
MAAIALITQITSAVDCRAHVPLLILATGIATSVALTKSASGMAATVAIGREIAPRVLVVQVLHRMATDTRMELATLGASTRRVNGTAGTAVISPIPVIWIGAQVRHSATVIATSSAITRGAISITANVPITQTTWAVHLRGLTAPEGTSATAGATAAATTRSAFTTAAIVQRTRQPQRRRARRQ